jgi:hypothetical protein
MTITNMAANRFAHADALIDHRNILVSFDFLNIFTGRERDDVFHWVELLTPVFGAIN